jgi:hypothetical protein
MKLMILAAFAACMFSSSADAADLVTNGDFTQLSGGVGQFDYQTVATGWANERDAGDIGYNFAMSNATAGSSGVSGNVSLWNASNGGSSTWDGKTASGAGNFAAMDGAYFTGPLSQTITGLVVGKAYTLSFNYAFAQQQGFSGDTIQSLDTSIGNGFVGFTRWNTGDFALSDHGFSGWNTATLSFTAKDTSEVLSFFAHGNLPVPPFALLSNVSIPVSGVPEAGTWAMMILGLGAVGLTLRRRTAMLAAA